MINSAIRQPPRGDATVVLVVDADIVFREFEAKILTDRGYTVLKATESEEAMQLVRENSNIHLLLAGFPIHESDADTLKLTQQFQRAHPGSPVLLLPGSFERFDERFNSPGRVGVMAKPFERIELINIVQRLLADVVSTVHQQPQGTTPYAIADSIA